MSLRKQSKKFILLIQNKRGINRKAQHISPNSGHNTLHRKPGHYLSAVAFVETTYPKPHISSQHRKPREEKSWLMCFSLMCFHQPWDSHSTRAYYVCYRALSAHLPEQPCFGTILTQTWHQCTQVPLQSKHLCLSKHQCPASAISQHVFWPTGFVMLEGFIFPYWCVCMLWGTIWKQTLLKLWNSGSIGKETTPVNICFPHFCLLSLIKIDYSQKWLQQTRSNSS